MGLLEQTVIQQVGFKHRGVGRMVYPGLLQLASFMSMNAQTHTRSFVDQIFRVAKGEAADHDKHNAFYDEYLAVMDMTAEFYLSTVERVFKDREIARNAFAVAGRAVDIGRSHRRGDGGRGGEGRHFRPRPVPRRARPAHRAAARTQGAHLEPGAGHYGIFAGKSWRDNIRPLVLSFMDRHTERKARPRPVVLPAVAVGGSD
jgi:poly(3-hydroxybutyrate) depolymerase